MALNNTNADAVATAFCSQIGVTDETAIQYWKDFARLLYSGNGGSLVNAIGATLGQNTVVTTGSATTQTGPTTPVPITIS